MLLCNILLQNRYFWWTAMSVWQTEGATPFIFAQSMERTEKTCSKIVFHCFGRWKLYAVKTRGVWHVWLVVEKFPQQAWTSLRHDMEIFRPISLNTNYSSHNPPCVSACFTLMQAGGRGYHEVGVLLCMCDSPLRSLHKTATPLKCSQNLRSLTCLVGGGKIHSTGVKHLSDTTWGFSALYLWILTSSHNPPCVSACFSWCKRVEGGIMRWECYCICVAIHSEVYINWEVHRRISLCKYSTSQRESMGLLEYQAIPPLRDVAHGGWLCTFNI